MNFLDHIFNLLTGLTITITFPQYVWLFSMLCIIAFLWRTQKSGKLDLTDILTKNGTSVSLTKVLQLIGGVTATWVIMHLTMSNALSESVFGLYLAYIGGVEGYSKFVAAKYKYDEKSVRVERSATKSESEDDSGN